MNNDNSLAYETTVTAISSKATYGGASTSIVSWFLSSEFGMLMGILIGVSGLFINWYYKHKEDKRRQEEHSRKMGMYE